MKDKKQNGKALRLKVMPFKFLTLLLFITLFGCGQKIDKVAQMKGYLTNGSKKYWTYLPEFPERRNFGEVYCIDGSYRDFYVSLKTGERLISRMNNVPIWELKEDSVLIFGKNGALCKIEYLNEDVLILNNMQIKEITVWIKSEDQHTDLVRDTTRSSFPLF